MASSQVKQLVADEHVAQAPVQAVHVLPFSQNPVEQAEHTVADVQTVHEAGQAVHVFGAP